jgi:tetratricopeptide (TPR) repeat protein
MQISDELKKELQIEFFEELLPKWDIENDFLQLGKKYLMNGEFIIAKNIFDDVLFVDPDHEIAKVYKKFAALVLAGEKSQEQLEIFNKLLQDVDYLLQKKEYSEILELGDILNDMIKKPERFYKLQSKIIEAKLNLTFDEFCTAYDHKKWDKVIKLGKELDNLGASEEVYPRKESLRVAKNNIIRNLPISIAINNIEIFKSQVYEKLVKSLHGFGKILIKRGKNILLECIIKDETNFGFPDKDENLPRYEDDFIIVKILVGEYTVSILIEPKE